MKLLPSAFSLGRYEYYYSKQNDCYNTAPLKQATANILAYIKYICIKITNSKAYCGSHKKNTEYDIKHFHIKSIIKRLTTKCKQNRRIKDYGVPLLIYLIGLGVVLRYALVDYALVSDPYREFLVYKLVVETGKWQAIPNDPLLSSCLWTSYIPGMFQRFFNTDIVMTYKLFPCFIFPTLPTIVYYLARKMVSPFYAFLASVFLIVQIYFLWAPEFSRIIVALSFFSLALLVVFNENLRFGKKAIPLVIIAVCLVTSHYGATYVTMFLLIITCIALVVLRQIRKTNYPYLKTLFVFVGVLAVATLVWHGLFNPGPLRTGGYVVRETVEGEIYLARIPEEKSTPEEASTPAKGGDTYGYWSLEVREGVIQVAFGKTLPDMNIPQKIEFAFSWLSILLMSWGLALTVRKWGLRNEWVVLMGVCYLTIVFSVVVPTIGIRYGIARVYFHMMVLLSVCFVVGCMDVADRLKIPRELLTMVVLVVLGLCTSGLMHNIFGLSRWGGNG